MPTISNFRWGKIAAAALVLSAATVGAEQPAAIEGRDGLAPEANALLSSGQAIDAAGLFGSRDPAAGAAGESALDAVSAARSLEVGGAGRTRVIERRRSRSDDKRNSGKWNSKWNSKWDSKYSNKSGKSKGRKSGKSKSGKSKSGKGKSGKAKGSKRSKNYYGEIPLNCRYTCSERGPSISLMDGPNGRSIRI